MPVPPVRGPRGCRQAAGLAAISATWRPCKHDREPEAHGVYAAYPHNRHLSAKMRAFVDYLFGCFQPMPPSDPPDVTNLV